MPEWHGEQIVETTTEARQGVTGHNALRAGLGHRRRDCRFRNRLFPVFPVTRHSPETKWCLGSLLEL
jgi:hypothetical protein